jgi:hypothetical protein
MREIKKWCPVLRPVKLLGDKHERAKCIAEEMVVGKFDVCVTSYEGTLKEKSALMKACCARSPAGTASVGRARQPQRSRLFAARAHALFRPPPRVRTRTFPPVL